MDGELCKAEKTTKGQEEPRRREPVDQMGSVPLLNEGTKNRRKKKKVHERGMSEMAKQTNRKTQERIEIVVWNTGIQSTGIRVTQMDATLVHRFSSFKLI